MPKTLEEAWSASDPASSESRGSRELALESEALRRRFLVYMTALMVGGALVWGGLAAYFGKYVAAAIPAGYIVLSGLNMAYLRWTGAFSRVRFVQIFASLSLPFAFQWTLGGFHASGACMLWGFVALIGSLTFTRTRDVGMWTAIYLALTVASGLVDGRVRVAFASQSGAAVESAFMTLNIAAISMIALGLTVYFLRQREQTMEALASARVKIRGLREEVRDARRLGQYTLEAKIGEGGMGQVYRAAHALLRRPTAIKLLLPDRVSDRDIERFEREVRLTATLTHPNTITIYDYGRTPDGVFYYAMELLDGANLEDIVSWGGPLPPGRVVHVIAGVAESLAEAHAAELVHRDIKPGNIMLCTRGGMADRIKVLDFGLVKDVSGVEVTLSRRDNMVAGTPTTMSPEAIAAPATIDGRSDLYSLGAVAYFIATGNNVFTGKNAVEVCTHHAATPPLPPSAHQGVEVPADLERLILDLLAKKPGDRPQTAQEVRDRALACACVGTWSQPEASAWWADHRKLVRRPQRVAESARTLDVRPRTAG